MKKTVLIKLLLLCLVLIPFQVLSEQSTSSRGGIFPSYLFGDDDSVNFKLLNRQKRDLDRDQDRIKEDIKILLRNINFIGEKRFLEKSLERYTRDKVAFEKRLKSKSAALVKAEKSLQNITGLMKINPEDPVLIEKKDLTNYYIENFKEDISDINYDLEYFTSDIERIQEDLKELTVLHKELEKEKIKLESNETNLFNVDNQLYDLLNRDTIKNSFRLNISIAFTILVAVVIIGFYWIAYNKDQVANNIFSGEKGIQFITLFLIIISIILFGIMGTLESRELSALLGSLSGYILGKTSLKKNDE